jgi:hypothetical protein
MYVIAYVIFNALPSSGIISVMAQTIIPIIGIEQPKTKRDTDK